jgi:SpoVK/Ycf46/Vps4 family AAA+-type ATPase
MVHVPTYETSFVTAPIMSPSRVPETFGRLDGWFADKQLRCYRRLLYPAHFCALEVETDAGLFSTDRETHRFALDGLGRGNDDHLAAYWAGAGAALEVDPYSAFDDPIVPPFELPHNDVGEHVGRLLEAGRAPLADVDPASVVAGPRVTTAYVPFWVGEFDGPDEETYVGVYYPGETDSDGRWLVEDLLEDEDLLTELRAGYQVGDGGSPSRSPSGSRSTGGRVAEPAGATADEAAGNGADEPVQPEDVEMEVDAVLEPNPDRTFADVGGMGDLKTRLRERVIAPLREPERYESYGLGAVSGLLLYGPPGCGKTHVAGALAGELGYNFIEVTPTDFASKYVGEGARKIAETFAIARANQPCLLFIDEIDGVARDRDEEMANTEKQAVNQLLVELESVQDEDVVVMGATNLLEDVDEAVLRSGRFDERIEVPPPDGDAREAVLEVHLDGRPTAEGLELAPTVEATEGYAASDLALIADTAARFALADDQPVGTDHLARAVEDVDSSIPSWLDRYEDDDARLVRPSGVSMAAVGDAETTVDRDLDAVAGMADQKRALRERVLHPVRNPERYAARGVENVDGVLLYGPPECGKTYLARALAGELDVPFLSVSPASLADCDDPVEGVGDAVRLARANEPCVLLVDDLDALAPADRGTAVGRRLATELEGLVGEDVVVVGATHLLEDVDGDVLHAGTFDERVEVPPPERETRAAVLEAALDEAAVAEDIDWEAAAEELAGFAVSDLLLVAEQAARTALRDDAAVTAERIAAAADGTGSTVADWGDRERYAASRFGSELRYIG